MIAIPNLNKAKMDPAVKKELLDILTNDFFGGVDLSKADTANLLLSLQQDIEDCTREGREIVITERTCAMTGLDKEGFLHMLEQISIKFDKHSRIGQRNIEKVERLTNMLGSDMSLFKNELLPTATYFTKKTILQFAEGENIELRVFKCHNCDKQPKDCEGSLRRCGSCGEAFYCSKECQKKHWKLHRSTCQKT